MKLFRKNRIALYIVFIVISTAVIGIVIFSKINGNYLKGKWQSEDNARKYIFDDNTLTITSVNGDYSVLYGYYIKDRSVLVLQSASDTYYYSIKIQGSQIALYSENSEIPEVLHRIYE